MKDRMRKKDKSTVDDNESKVTKRPTKRPATHGLVKMTDLKKKKAEGELLRDEPPKVVKTGW